MHFIEKVMQSLEDQEDWQNPSKIMKHRDFFETYSYEAKFTQILFERNSSEINQLKKDFWFMGKGIY